MRKKSEKCMRRLMALLVAVCMFSEVAYTPVIVSASGSTVSIETEDNGVLEQAENLGSEQNGEPEKESGDAEETENPDEKDQTGEKENGKEENPEDSDGEDSGSGDGEESEQDGKEPEKDGEESEEVEPEDAEQPDEMETEETEDEEIVEDSEEALMLLSEETGDEEGSGEEYVTDDTYTDENGVVYHYYGYEDGTANIYELESYKIADKQGKVINVPADIDGYTVTRITFKTSLSTSFPSITIPETITYMGNCVFEHANIGELYYNAVAAVSYPVRGEEGCILASVIDNLNIGENVKVIPDALFKSTKINNDELVLNVESIGDDAFYGGTNVTDLVIGEDVKEIGVRAFGWDSITNLHYNAVNATLRHEATLVGPFYFGTISSITFGEKVETIPNNFLVYVHYSAESLELPESLITIGECAFYSSSINIGELTIGENIASIGLRAFLGINIGILNYNAVKVEVPELKGSSAIWNPFYSTKIGELRLGESVGVLPDYIFYCVELEQDELVIPDSVTYIGTKVFSRSISSQPEGKMSIGTLIIGINVSYMGTWAFGGGTFDKVIVYAIKSGNALSYDEKYLPVCGSVEIHRGASSYRYFTANTEAENITLMCEDIETTYGEEYYNEWKDCFVTVITDTCAVCGYKTVKEEYEDAYTVLFQLPDGMYISCQYLHSGEDAVEPEAPEMTGYEFTGWDIDFTNVTSNITVTAQYKVKTFSVVFKDGDDIISEQEIEYKCDAEVPENPTRPEEEWGKWEFIEWDGNYRNVTQNEVIQATYKKILNKYEVVFYDAEGNVLSRQNVIHGESAEVPDAPEKKATAQYSYIFIKWNGDTENITGNTGFYPVYDAKLRSYTVTFMNGDTVLDTQTVEYGHAAKAPEAPEKEPTEEYCYPFTGWDGDITNITADAVFYPTYGMEARTYTVTFMNGDAVFDTQKVEYGASAVTPAEPKKEADAKYTYSFIGWDSDYSVITGDMVVHALYEKKEIPSKGKPKPGKKDNTKKKDDESGGGGNDDDGGGNGGGDGTEPAPDNGGEKPEPETEEENVEITDDGRDKIMEKQTYSAEIQEGTLGEVPQITALETEEYAEIVKGEVLHEDTENVEGSQETGIEAVAEDDRDISVLGWFLLFVGIVVLGCLLVWLLLLYLVRRKVKVCGKILDESGCVPCGIQITLSGKDIMETEPDEAGCFSFEGLKKDYYGLNVYNEDGAKIFSADIRMEVGSGVDVFMILESDCSNVKTSKKRGIYEVNLTV